MELARLPRIVAAEDEFAVLYKPSAMHTVPLCASCGDTLLDWLAARLPEARSPRGRLPREGGAVHRLDFETSGLCLFALTQRALDAFAAQQEAGRFVKEYRALTRDTPVPPAAGFPPAPPAANGAAVTLVSGFRPYGPGRASVRPSTGAEGALYRTELAAPRAAAPGRRLWPARLTRGFRHQVRCHLAWLGYPLINDTRYGGLAADGPFGLEAVRLEFAHPGSNTPLSFGELSRFAKALPPS